jgi:hypothetical protein
MLSNPRLSKGSVQNDGTWVVLNTLLRLQIVVTGQGRSFSASFGGMGGMPRVYRPFGFHLPFLVLHARFICVALPRPNDIGPEQVRSVPGTSQPTRRTQRPAIWNAKEAFSAIVPRSRIS